MKKVLALLLAAALVFSLAACTGSNESKEESKGNELAGTYDVTVWVAEKIVDLTKKQIADFNEKNEDGIVINATVEPVSESEAATNMITDVAAGGDIFCFAQDQFARLVNAGALAKLGTAAAATVTEANDPGVVAAATSGSELYAYPLTSDNGYFMYYDKSVISEDIVDSLEDIIAACEANNKYFSFEMGTSAWYNASFFFATGATTEWTTDDNGNFVSYKETYNSPEGLIAVKGMEKLVKSTCHNNSSSGSAFASESAVVVTGTWDYDTVKDILGDNMGCTDLPSFTVDGKEYHLGSFNGCKLMGVKPQTDAYKGAALHKLAQYLSGEECQMERFNEVSWGPSNKADQQNEAVQSNPGLAALLKQNAYSVPQGQFPDAWWDVAKVIGDEVKEAADEADLQKALDNYTEKMKGILSAEEEAADMDTTGYMLVGAWNGWNNKDDAIRMTEADGVYTLTITVEESDYMGGRIVKPGEWDNDKGAAQVTEGKDLLSEDSFAEGNGDNNMIFAAAGTYTVTFTEATGEITIAAE